MTSATIDKSLLSGTLHYSVSLAALGRKRFPEELSVPGLGNGHAFQRIKVADDKSYAFYRQFAGMATISLNA